MTAKEYLSRHWPLEKKVKGLIRKIDELKKMETKITSTLSDMPRGNEKSNKPLDHVLKIEELSEQVIEVIEQSCEIQGEIIETLEQMEPGLYQNLLYDRYIHHLSLEQIAVDNNYNYAYVRQLHGIALLKVAPFIKVLTQSNIQI